MTEPTICVRPHVLFPKRRAAECHVSRLYVVYLAIVARLMPIAAHQQSVVSSNPMSISQVVVHSKQYLRPSL